MFFFPFLGLERGAGGLICSSICCQLYDADDYAVVAPSSNLVDFRRNPYVRVKKERKESKPSDSNTKREKRKRNQISEQKIAQQKAIRGPIIRKDKQTNLLLSRLYWLGGSEGWNQKRERNKNNKQEFKTYSEKKYKKYILFTIYQLKDEALTKRHKKQNYFMREQTNKTKKLTKISEVSQHYGKLHTGAHIWIKVL